MRLRKPKPLPEGWDVRSGGFPTRRWRIIDHGTAVDASATEESARRRVHEIIKNRKIALEQHLLRRSMG